MPLVLSLFPGIGLLDRGFELEGFTVVRGPDVLWGGDVRSFHPPAGRFDGIIGGPPCQAFSALSNLVRAKGIEPRFGNLIPEFSRCIEEAEPAWFLMENVPRAPDPEPAGYAIRSFLLDNWSSLGNEQQRRRRFWFGVRGDSCPELRRWIDFALELPPAESAVMAGHDGRWPYPGKSAGQAVEARKARRASDTGAHQCHARPKGGHGERYTLAEMLELQGLPADFFDESPFTVVAKRKMIGNGVPIPMARALARAIKVGVINESNDRSRGEH